MLEMKSESEAEWKRRKRSEMKRAERRSRAYPKVEVIANEGNLIRGYERDFQEKSNGSKRTEGSVDHRSQQNRNLKYSLRSLYRFEGSIKELNRSGKPRCSMT